MSRKHATAAARKRARLAARWGRYLLAGALLAVLVASGIAAQLFATSGTPQSSSLEDGDPTLYAHGHRLRPLVEEAGNAQTLNIYDTGGRIIGQAGRDGSGGQETRHLLADHLGSTQAGLDGGGNVVAQLEYGPYGKTRAAGTAATWVRYRYTGHPWNESQGLYETPARGYDPTQGRFLSVDPQRQGASPYVYAGGDPVNYIDPTGGVKVPFYMKSGWLEDDFRTTLFVAQLFEMRKDQDMKYASTFKKSPNSGKSTVRSQAAKFQHGKSGKKGKRAYEYNDEFYWIVGEGEGVPDDFYRSIHTVRSRVGGIRSFAKKIILLDLTGTDQGEKIRTDLEANDYSALLVPAKPKRADVPQGVGPINAFEVGGVEYNPIQFRDYVHDEMFKQWPELTVSISVRDLPPKIEGLEPGLLMPESSPEPLPVSIPLSERVQPGQYWVLDPTVIGETPLPHSTMLATGGVTLPELPPVAPGGMRGE